MNFYFQCKRNSLVWTLLIAFSVPSIGWANDKILFQFARNMINDPTVESENSLESQQASCLNALSELQREKETFQLMQHWPSARKQGEESRLSNCWRNGLYWAGLNYSQQSELSLSRKLASLAGHENVPPEKLITQLLAQETKPFKQVDQEMVNVLRFSARYDLARQSRDPNSEIQKLIPDAIALAPQALHLLETSYPPKGYHTISYHPVRTEIAQCALAIQVIVPLEKRTDAMNKLLERIDLLFGLGCFRRGWTSAFDAGLDLLAKRDEPLAILIWQSRFLETFGVEVNDSILLSSDRLKTHPKLSRFISSVKSILNLFRNQTYKKRPEVLTALLQEPDSELWRFYMLLTLETARLCADEKLLQLASRNLLEQSQRLYNPKNEDYKHMLRDLNILYFSAYRAAQRVNNKELQNELMKRMLSLFPAASNEDSHNNILSDRIDEISIWAYLISDRSGDPMWIQKFEEQAGELGAYYIGIFWAITGKTKIKDKEILTMYNKPYDFHEVAYGAGFAVGTGRAPFTVGEAWIRLSQADCTYNTIESLTAFCSGYTNGKESPQSIWDTRLFQELTNPKLSQ